MEADVIIIGGGSSGLMAAAQASAQGVSVLVLEKNRRPGRKLALSGGGRCNVTNRAGQDQLLAHIPGNGVFLHSALSQFDQEDIIAFFESRGVALKEEDHGRMFPVTNRARTILDTLTDEIIRNGGRIEGHCSVQKLLIKDHHIQGVLTTAGEEIGAKTVIIATGGKAYPRTGSTGDGYRFAQEAGHTLTRLYATEAPLLSNDSFIQSKALQGTALRDVLVTLWDGKKALVKHRMDMIFTHFGFSGPAILRTSGHVNQYLYTHKKQTAQLTLDVLPDIDESEWLSQAEKQRDKEILTLLKQHMPERFAEEVLRQCQLDPKKAFKQLDHKDKKQLLHFLKAFPLTTTGSQPIELGFVTGGGVELKEINPQTMESKLIDGLYFCGEVLDINGYTGGYNITAAFVTGTVAGRHAAWHAMSL